MDTGDAHIPKDVIQQIADLQVEARQLRAWIRCAFFEGLSVGGTDFSSDEVETEWQESTVRALIGDG